jgi:hypothetical protein
VADRVRCSLIVSAILATLASDLHTLADDAVMAQVPARPRPVSGEAGEGQGEPVWSG